MPSLNEDLSRAASHRDPALIPNAILLLLLVMIWAISWPAIKVGVSEIPPIWFAVLRYVIATAVMFPLVAVLGSLAFPARQDWRLILVSGALQMAAFAAFMALALVTLPPGRASVLAYATPLWVVPLAAWRLGEWLPRSAVFGVMCGVLGVVAIATPSLLLSQAHHMAAYACLMAASIAWAVSIVFVRGHQFAGTALSLAPWQMLVAMVLLLPFALLIDGPLPTFGMAGWLSLAFVGPIATAFAYWALVQAGRYFHASTVSMALLATPSVGIVISALTLGEQIDLSLVVGVLLTGLGIWLAIIYAQSSTDP